MLRALDEVFAQKCRTGMDCCCPTAPPRHWRRCSLSGVSWVRALGRMLSAGPEVVIDAVFGPLIVGLSMTMLLGLTS